MASRLLPDEYRNYIEHAIGERGIAATLQVLKEADPARDPAILASSPAHYHVPPKCNLYLYQQSPKENRKRLESSLGPCGTDGYWKRLAAIAAHAFDRSDWITMGRLSYHVDRGIQYECRRHETDQMEAASKLAQKVLRKWTQLFDVTKGKLMIPEYLEGALAYFRQLPAGFAIPPDLLKYSKSRACDWPLLRMFWTQHRGAWKRHPKSIDRLAEFPNPFLAVLGDQLRTDRCQPLEDLKKKRLVMFDPFRRLASEERVRNRDLKDSHAGDPSSQDQPPRSEGDSTPPEDADFVLEETTEPEDDSIGNLTPSKKKPKHWIDRFLRTFGWKRSKKKKKKRQASK